MSRLKNVKSLTEICMDFILENKDFFYKRYTPREPKDGVDALDSVDPAINSFDHLPTELLEELIRRLRDRVKEARIFEITPFLTLLMTPRLRTLDLTALRQENDISGVLHMASIRSLNLETLLLVYNKYLYGGNFYFIPKFQKLRKLDISSCKAGDDCFNLIGINCPDLRELFVKYGEVSDDGIRKLCVVGNCKLICILHLENCSKITTKGIQMALDNLPQLSVLFYDSLLERLAEIAQNAIDQKLSLPKYSLTALHMLHYTIYKTGNLRQSVLLCPNVTEVYLTTWAGLRNTDLLSLLSLENIYTIEITTGVLFIEGLLPLPLDIDRKLSFVGLVPLLKKFGSCLKRLRIGNQFLVDNPIPVIIEFCPNLESLALDHCKTTQSTRTEVKRPTLQKLKKLTLEYCNSISLDDLLTLLSSPSLSYIFISHCKNLTENVLQRVANLHGFRNLEYLYLHYCNSLTKTAIDFFFKESYQLREITVKSDLYHFRHYHVPVIEDNFDFNVMD